MSLFVFSGKSEGSAGSEPAGGSWGVVGGWPGMLSQLTPNDGHWLRRIALGLSRQPMAPRSWLGGAGGRTGPGSREREVGVTGVHWQVHGGDGWGSGYKTARDRNQQAEADAACSPDQGDLVSCFLICGRTG